MKKLLAVRKRLGWSLRYLGERAGVHPSTISLLERQDRMPTLRIAKKLAKAMKPLMRLEDFT